MPYNHDAEFLLEYPASTFTKTFKQCCQ